MNYSEHYYMTHFLASKISFWPTDAQMRVMNLRKLEELRHTINKEQKNEIKQEIFFYLRRTG